MGVFGSFLVSNWMWSMVAYMSYGELNVSWSGECLTGVGPYIGARSTGMRLIIDIEGGSRRERKVKRKVATTVLFK